MYLDSSISELKGVGPKYVEVFHKNGIRTIRDLLLRFPVLYIDFSQVSPRVEEGRKLLYQVTIGRSKLSRIYHRRLTLLIVNGTIGSNIGSDDNPQSQQLPPPVQLIFFNQHYLKDQFKEGEQVYIFGTFEMRNNCLTANTPLVFRDPLPAAVIPLYDKIGTLKSGTLRKLISTGLSSLSESVETLPVPLVKHYHFAGEVESFRGIHLPQNTDPQFIAGLKKRFIYREFLLFQLELQYIRSFFKTVSRVHFYDIPEDVEKVSSQYLPFPLTVDQVAACRDIWNDLQKQVVMQRLLQGDVGSGKTVVAFMALLPVVCSRFQGAFLAPTEILAKQHFAGGSRFFKNHRIALLTGSTSAKERKQILQQLASGEIDILFGTHALLNDTVQFKQLAMVVIDEQHRFGVSQRAALYYKGQAVDLLVTTATPIPRTMLLSLYNDLSVSVIKTKPQGRLPIRTKIIAPERREEFFIWLKQKIEAGEKAFIILPLIEDSEYFTELASIETETPYFKEVFKGINIGIVTGRASATEKDSMLTAFASGDMKVLIATTVIEVGIDVPDAVYIVIENADRYGLSQLHQLRGRVGRGDRQSFCYLFPSAGITESGRQRLETIAATNDGFKIAETDLEMRGGGIISGLEQSGYLDFRVGNLQDHHETFKEAQRDAGLILTQEPLQNEMVITLFNRIKSKLKEINFS